MSRAPQPPAAPFRRPGLAGTSLGLCREDFGVASEPAREDLHRRLGAWARGVAVRFQSSGLPLDVFCVDEPAGACAFFVHPGTNLRDARAALVLGVGSAGVRAGLELTPAHVRRVDARFSDPAHALSLSAALEALPEQFVVQLGEDDAPLQAPHLPMDELRRRFERSVTERRALWIGWSVARDIALEHAALLDEQLEDALAALAGVYELLAGDGNGEAGDKGRDSRESHPRKGENAAGHLRAKHRGGHGSAGRDDEGERRPGAASPPNRRASTRAREERRDREADAEGELESDVSADVPSRAAKSDDMKAAPRAVFRRRTLRAVGSKNDSSLPIERGSRVRVLEGPFSGKVGLVHELDGKGGARVMLGLLAVRLEVKNLTTQVQGRYRPVLSSSHRKPLPVRS
jgi:hypothetical protein